jgi:hypothetical protein
MATSLIDNRDNIDFDPMFRAACRAAIVTTGTKLLVTVAIARQLGAGLGLGLYWGFIPYVQFDTSRQNFVRITSVSTLIMSLVAGVCFAAMVMRGRRRQAVAGWFCAVASIFETVAIEAVLHRLNGPFFDFRYMRWTLLVLVASLAVTAAWMVLDRPWRADFFDTGTSHQALAGS